LHPGPLSHCLAAVDYGYPWDRLITRLKFHEDTALAAQFAPLLHRLPHAQQLLQSCDALIPMPLSAQRLRERGFNQAGLLARSLSPGKIRHDILLRVLHTRAQSECTLAERMNNVRHAFAVQPGQQSQAQDRHFVLVDDVMTTGASLTHAAQVLLQAGARQVSAIVLARTPSQSESH
jgi:ComF family protein